MGADGGGGDGSGPECPTINNKKVKILCSHGGKILPRPIDGHLRYVGGETRVVSFPRDINFSELMKRLRDVCNGKIVLKYQLPPEDLEALVSVKTDEDLRHMVDEYDRHENAGTPKLRAFLFPCDPIIIDNTTSSPLLEQRYIDAVNGIIRHTRPPPSPVSSSSAGSSPKTPDSCTTSIIKEPMVPSGWPRMARGGMTRVRSSPSISSLTSSSVGGHHYHNQNHLPTGHSGREAPSKAPQQPPRLTSVRSVGRDDYWKYQVAPMPTMYPHQTAGSGRGSWLCGGKCMQLGESGVCHGDRKLEGAVFNLVPKVP
ncbi:hypothetical protein NMG60_11036730 [Bertholletia excelsa]